MKWCACFRRQIPLKNIDVRLCNKSTWELLNGYLVYDMFSTVDIIVKTISVITVMVRFDGSDKLCSELIFEHVSLVCIECVSLYK